MIHESTALDRYPSSFKYTASIESRCEQLFISTRISSLAWNFGGTLGIWRGHGRLWDASFNVEVAARLFHRCHIWVGTAQSL